MKQSQNSIHPLIEFLNNLYHAGMSRDEVLRLGYEFAQASLYTDDREMHETDMMLHASAMLAQAVKARNEVEALRT